jgi:poly(3-hydroxybutyrate) depolymerase
MTLADIGTEFVTNSGLNEIAESNNIIILYPQAKKSILNPSNPNGCFDWWGYTCNKTPL